MRFLVDANLPLSTAPRTRALGHEAVDVREIGMGAAEDAAIAKYARENGLCLLTRDKDFGDVRNYPPNDYAGIVVLDLPDETVAADILKLLESFLSRKEWLDALHGQLTIMQPGRVRFRPA